MLFGADVLRHHEDVADFGAAPGCTSWQLPVRLTCSLIALTCGLVQAGALERGLEQRAGIGQLEVAAAVLDGAGVGQGEDGLAAVAFAAGDGADGAGGRDGGLGGVADAVLLDAVDDACPIEGRAAPVVACKGAKGTGRLPAQVLPDRRCCP